MQILFIILIVFALLGGILSKCSSDNPNLQVSSFSMFGIKSKQQIERERQERLLSEYLKDKDALLGDSQNQMGALSKVMEEASKRDRNVDLLQLKNLMQQFEDQNVLMIEGGKELVVYNEKRKKMNQQMAQEMQKKMFLSDSRQQELLEKQKDALRKQQDIIHQLQQMKNDESIKKDSGLKDKIEQASNKTLSNLEKLREQQERLRSANEARIDNAASMKYKMDDLKQKSQDKQDQIQEQTRQINERIKDQMERFKEKNKI